MIIIGILLFLVGFGIFAGSIFFGFRRRSFLNKSIEANGIVISSGRTVVRNSGNRQPGVVQIGGRNETWFQPIVRFQTADGQTIDYQSAVRTKKNFTEGQQIQVNYDPQNPQSVTLGNRGSFLMWLPFVFVGFVGFGLFSIGFIFTLLGLVGF